MVLDDNIAGIISKLHKRCPYYFPYFFQQMQHNNQDRSHTIPAQVADYIAPGSSINGDYFSYFI